MSQRARLIFIIASVVAFIVFEALIGRGRSETQVEFDEVVERYFSGADNQEVTVKLRSGAQVLSVNGSTKNSEEVLRILGQISAADIFSKGSGTQGDGSYQIVVDIGDGGREFSVWLSRRDVELDLRTKNLIKLFQLFGRVGAKL